MISGLDECSVRTTLQGTGLRAPQFERSTCVSCMYRVERAQFLARSMWRTVCTCTKNSVKSHEFMNLCVFAEFFNVQKICVPKRPKRRHEIFSKQVDIL